jgi:hypothetical protein
LGLKQGGIKKDKCPPVVISLLEEDEQATIINLLDEGADIGDRVK